MIKSTAILSEARVRFLGPCGESHRVFCPWRAWIWSTDIHACKKLKNTHTPTSRPSHHHGPQTYMHAKKLRNKHAHTYPTQLSSLHTAMGYKQRQTHRHTHTPTQLPGLHTASFRQEVSERFRIHLLPPVAMETNPSLFFPYGTGNEG